MEKNTGPPWKPPAGTAAAFPETQTEVLAQAAAGHWDRFFGEYLTPCWGEVVLACRAHGLQLDQAQDLFQELTLRLMRDGQFKQTLAEEGHGNLPGRYLQYRAAGLPSARFRTYLKRVIQHLILEHLRQRRREPQAPGGDAEWEPWVESSVASSVDRQWVACCLVRAAARLQVESQTARTRGQRRLFAVLHRATVDGWPPARIADELGLERSTVADLLTRARQRFVQLLQQVTGISSRDELKSHVAAVPDELVRAFAVVHEVATGEGCVESTAEGMGP